MKYLKYLAIVLGVGISAGIIYLLYTLGLILPKASEFTEVANGVYFEQTFESSVAPEVVYASNESYYMITKDSVTHSNLKGETLWQNTFSLSNLFYDNSKNYLAITERNTNNAEVYVYTSAGLAYTIKDLKSPIANITINDNGYLSVIVNNSDSYKANVYNNLGEVIFSYIFEDTTIIPITSAIANDNKTLVINELDTSKIYPSSIFVYFDITTPENNSIYAVKTYNNEREYFLSTTYITDTTLCAISNKFIYFISTADNNPTIVSSIALNNQLKFAKRSNNKMIVVYGEPLNNLSIYPENTVQIISDKGEQITVPQSTNITLLEDGQSGFVLGYDNTYTYYTLDGKQVWEHFAGYEVKSCVPFNKGETAVFSGLGKITLGKFSK